MRIVFVAPRFHTNQLGVVQTLRAFGNWMEFHVTAVGATEDHSVLAPIEFAPGGLSKLLRKVVRKKDPLGVMTFPPILSYLRYLKSCNPDLVIVRNPSRYFSIIAAICARIVGAKVVIYTQTPLYFRYSLPKRLGRGFLLWALDAAWMTPVVGERGEYKKPWRSYYLPFVVSARNDLDSENSAPTRNGECVANILMVAKYQPRKNHALLLEALARLRMSINFELTLIGQCVSAAEMAVMEGIIGLVEKLGLSRSVRFVVNVNPDDMAGYYQRADLFVLPSSYESASISVLEAIANGTPAVCSSTCGTRFYIVEGVTGATFCDQSLQSLTAVLGGILSDWPRMGQMKVDCRTSARDCFSPEVYIRHFRSMLRERWGMDVNLEASSDVSKSLAVLAPGEEAG